MEKHGTENNLKEMLFILIIIILIISIVWVTKSFRTYLQRLEKEREVEVEKVVEKPIPIIIVKESEELKERVQELELALQKKERKEKEEKEEKEEGEEF